MLLKRLFINLLIGTLVGGFIALLNTQPLFRRIELSLYNTRFETFRGQRTAPQDVVILGIDESSLQEMGSYPWTRDMYPPVVDKLFKYGAKAVAFDIMFATESKFPAADRLLANSLAKYNDKIVVASKFDFGTTSRISGSEAGNSAGEAVDAASYTPPIFEDKASFGAVNFEEDLDNQLRRGQAFFDLSKYDIIPSTMTRDEKYEPAFALKLLSLVNPDQADAIYKQHLDKELWINYAGPPQTFNTLSYYIPYKLDTPGFGPDYFTELVGKRPEAFFKDKIVFVGMTAESMKDTMHTPFVAESNVKMPGVEIHANFFETLRQNNAFNPAPMSLNLLLIFVLALSTAILCALMHPLAGLALMVALIAGYSILNIYFFQFQRLFIDWFAPLLGVFLAYSATYAYRFFVEEREKRRIRHFFKSYVSPKLVEELLKDPKTMPSLKSERRMVSILFSDIAGFTSMSESMPPDEVEHILNEYLTAMSEIVFENDGTLDKYIGDAVMAVWGNVGPANPKTDAYKAVNTAIQMQRKLSELREKWLGEGMVPLQIRIGVNTGEALVGNFGSPQKMDYTVIGDAVNTASRLEGLNKEFGTTMIISQNTYDLVNDRVSARHCGTAKVKGKEEPVSVYELIEWKDEAGALTEVRDTKWIKGSNETQWK